MSGETNPTIDFIQAVKKWPCIYDMKHEGFKNRSYTYEAWVAIASEYGSGHNLTELQQKWRSLRDCYLKYKRSIGPGLCTPSTRQYRKWRWAKHLRFLDGCLPANARSFSLKKKINHISVKPEPEEDVEENNDTGNPQFTEVYLETPRQNDDSTLRCPKDGTYHLFQSYAETFRKFTPKRQALLKFELAKMFSAAELEQLDETTIE